MALDFKQTSHNHKIGKKQQARNTKGFDNFKGKHLPTRKLFRYQYIGDEHIYVKANMHKWLLSQLNRPIDKVFSDFVKEYKRSYKGPVSPSEFFYSCVDKFKDFSQKWWKLNKFYVSSSGFLCKYSKYHPVNISYNAKYNRRQDPKTHIAYNKAALKDFEIKTNEFGPKYVGKLWAEVKGITKILNVWVVYEDKWTGKPSIFCRVNVKKEERLYLQDFTVAHIAGFGSSYSISKDYYGIPETVKYLFIVKLSDIK